MKITLNADCQRGTIGRHIYGHFAEHLGRCIYGGIYVGPESPTPSSVPKLNWEIWDWNN